MTQARSRRGRLVYAGRLALLTVLYVGLGRLGHLLVVTHTPAALVWAPSGIALAALLLDGYALWPGVALGCFLNNLWVGHSLVLSLIISAGATLEAVAGAFALRAIPGFRGALDRFVDVAALVVLAGMLGAALSATVAVVALALSGCAPRTQLADIWIFWWTGDLIGVVLLAPLLLTWARGPRLSREPVRVAEAVALGALLVAGAIFLFTQPPEVVARIPILQPYVLFPLLVWAALRFGMCGAATSMFLVAVIAVWGTYTGRGAFVRGGRAESLLALYVFLSSKALAVLTLGSIVSERERGRRALLESEERQRLAVAEAQAATRAKDDFLAVLSHELRTPLQSMLGWAQIVKAHADDPDAVRRGLATIERNVRTQAQLIEDLLDVSRIVAGKLRMDWGPVDLAEVVGAAVESSSAAAEARGLRIEAELSPLGTAVLGDPVRLQQVVVNLIGNAVKFTPSGGRIRVRLRREGATARIVVEDTGRGIAAELLPHVFDRFRQSVDATTRSHGGLGLGLAIVHHLVQEHGGTVTAASAGEGQGATFTVTLPIACA